MKEKKKIPHRFPSPFPGHAQPSEASEAPRRQVDVLAADPEIGLTASQVQARIDAGWVSGEAKAAGKTEREIVFSNIFTFFNLVFAVLGLLLIISGSSIMNMTFLVVAICNSVVGIVQEIRAKRAVDQLTLVAARPVTVVRDGQRQQADAQAVVRDDIAIFGPGDQICADGILRAGTLQVDESLITGEADPIPKAPGDTLRSGSVVLSGHGRVQLTAVGQDAFASQLTMEAKSNPSASKSEMMRSLDRLIQVVGIALIPVGLVLFYQEFSVLHLGFQSSVEGTVAALVGMIPEGLYLLTSIAMAASALKLSRQRVLVQDMNCIETLARVDVLCVDKTGTITEPTMQVEDLIPLAPVSYDDLEDILAALYSGQEPDNDTARAMAELYSRENSWEWEKQIPFSSEYKWSGGVFVGHGAYLAGAPEYILGSAMEDYRQQIEEWTDLGYRVLLVAGYDGEPVPGALVPERVTPLALCLLSSPLREQAKETFAYFMEQGVSIRVISGDNPHTVSQVALRAGIPGAEKFVDASTLETPQDYENAVRECIVFGRVTPAQKKALVQALQNQGHTVAMTGDGVNDLLAMKQADCSVAMASGAQAASQMASLVLLDSDFSAMPSITAEGRRVINNIQRSATLYLVKNIFSLFLSVITLFTAWPYPLQPIHLTVISSLTIGIPSFFLAMEPNYDRVQGGFLQGVLRRAFPGGMCNIFVVLAAQAYRELLGLSADQTATICAGVLGVTGLMVLFQVCKPFQTFRKVIWGAMAVAMAVCFTLLGDVFDFQTGSAASNLVMGTLLLMTPTVFYIVQHVFDFCEKLYRKLPRRRTLSLPPGRESES